MRRSSIDWAQGVEGVRRGAVSARHGEHDFPVIDVRRNWIRWLGARTSDKYRDIDYGREAFSKRRLRSGGPSCFSVRLTLTHER